MVFEDQQPFPATSTSAPTSSNSKSKLPYLGGVVLLIVLGLGYYFLIMNHATNSQTTSGMLTPSQILSASSIDNVLGGNWTSNGGGFSNPLLVNQTANVNSADPAQASSQVARNILQNNGTKQFMDFIYTFPSVALTNSFYNSYVSQFLNSSSRNFYHKQGNLSNSNLLCCIII